MSGSAQPPARTGDECQFLMNIPQGGSCNPKTIWDAGQDAWLPTFVALATDGITYESWSNGSVVKEGCD